MSPFAIVLSLVLTYICSVQGQCPTFQDGKRVHCLNLYQCPSMLDLVNKPDRTQQETDFLIKSKCGYDDKTPKLCCPTPCYTPEGKPGRCVGLYQCPHLLSMLQTTNVPQASKSYIVNSICKGPDPRSVCCADPQHTRAADDNCAATLTAFPPAASTECCGVDSVVGNKITGGNATTVDMYPWLALIEYVKDNKVRTLCGGSLISTRYVMTAAHCLTGAILGYGTPKYVRLGEYDTSNDGPDCQTLGPNQGKDCTDGVVTIDIEQTIPHPQYSKNTKQGKNDIGLIRLASPAPFSDFIRPICLPTSDTTINPPNNFILYAAGWGAVSDNEPFSVIKMHVDLPYMDRAQCQQQYTAPGLKATLGTGQICAGGQPGKDSCRGDSGGPLMYQNGRIWEALGVVSFGPTPCGKPGVPGVYSKVFEYDSWIRSNIRA